MKLNNTKYVVLGFIAIIAILLVSNYIKSENSKKAEQLAFEKKKECASYLGGINKKIPRNSGVPEAPIENQLDEIWYSPVLNSCLYSVKSIITPSDSNIKPITVYAIRDYLTNKEVPLSFDFNDTGTDDSMADHFRRFEFTKAETKGEQI